MTERVGSAGAVERAEALQELGRHAQALEVVGAALVSDPDDVDLLRSAAVSEFGLDRHGAAERHLRAALRVDPGSGWTLALLSMARRHLGDMTEAVAYGRRAVQCEPLSAATHLQLALALAASGDGHDEAVAEAHRSLELAPGWSAGHHGMATVMYPYEKKRVSRKRLRAAETHLRLALEAEPGDAALLNDLARVQMAKGRHVNAAGNLARAVQQDPNQHVIHTNMDIVLGTRIARAHWVLFLMWLVLRHTAGTAVVATWVPAVLAVVGAALIGGMVWSLYRSIGPAVPAFLRGFLRRQRLLTAWAACIVLSFVAFVAATVVPQSSTSVLITYSGVPLLVGAGLSWVRYFRHRRQS